MTAVFEKLQTYIALLALPSKCLCYSWFNVKNLEYKKLEKGGGLACLSEKSLGSGTRKTWIHILQPFIHLWPWANHFTFLLLFSHL